MNQGPITAEELDDLDLQMPSAFMSRTGRQQVSLADVVTDWGPLTAEHVQLAEAHAASGAVIGVRGPDVKALRHTHHRLAQLLAGGMDETVAAKLCNYSFSRVSILKANPAFAELLAHYAATKDEAFADFVDAAAALSIDMMGRLQQILDEEPEKLSPTHVMDALKLLADRTGHAPVTKTQNVNVNLNLGDKLRLARERANEMYLDVTPRLATGGT